MNITICFTYFKSLGLENLRASLYSLCVQDLSRVSEIVIVDNDTPDSLIAIHSVIDSLKFPVPVNVISVKHGSSHFTHSWSTNLAVRAAKTEWVLFSRADYILDFELLEKFVAVIASRPDGWDGFVTSNVYHLNADIERCENTEWRTAGPQVFKELIGAEESYTAIDAGVWMVRKSAFDRVHGLDEGLVAWGHSQTHFQYKLYKSGTEFVRIPEVLFYHPQHSAVRDLALANNQLLEHGIDLKEMWARYEGVQPY